MTLSPPTSSPGRRNARQFPPYGAFALAALGSLGWAAAPANAQGPGFHQSAITPTGVLSVDSHVTYYDGSDGTLAALIALPTGATSLQFRVTGGVITDSSQQFGSAGGLYSSGQTPYNFSGTRFNGTYQGTALGSTTGIDPSLFGVFFSPSFSGTPLDSLNYRSDSGLTPDPRTLTSYAPSVNQPFYIGDGYTGNNAFSTTSDLYTPGGAIQTFAIPAGARYLLLGIGADIDLGDNQDGANDVTGFSAHVYDNAPLPVPKASSVVSFGLLLLFGLGAIVVSRRKRHAVTSGC